MKEFNYSFGDVLWCDRTFNGDVFDEEVTKKGPFIVIEQREGFVYAVKGYGYKDGDKMYKHNLYINPKKDSTMTKLRKYTTFRADEICMVPNNYILNHIGVLEDFKKDLLKRKLLVQNTVNPGFLDPLNNTINVKNSVGDIIEIEGERYLVIDNKDEETYKVIPYFQTEVDNKFIYHFDFAFDILRNRKDIKLVALLTPEKKEEIQNRYYAYIMTEKHKNDPDKKIDQGSLIMSDSKLFYVSTYQKNNYLCYEMKLSPLKNNDVKIDDQFFNIDFTQVEISIDKENIKKLFDLSEEDITKIRNLKRVNKIQNRNEKYSFKTNRASECIKKRNYQYYGKVLHRKVWPLVRCGVYKEIDEFNVEVVDLEMLLKGEFETFKSQKNHLYFENTEKNYLTSFLQRLTQDINDPRYNEFLIANGIYDRENFHDGFARKRENENDAK